MKQESRVFLRNGQQAIVTGLSSATPYHVFGYIICRDEMMPSLWHEGGEWREDKACHSLDIVALVNASGQTVHLKSALK